LYDRLYSELKTSNLYQNNAYVFNDEFKCGEGYRLKVEKNEYTTKEDFIWPDAVAEMAKVLAVLAEYLTMKIDIRSHTDSRASHKYNDKLSDGRTKSTIEWLISQGISASCLTAKGYGERQLINECADGVKCSEEAHQANRKSEFIILEM